MKFLIKKKAIILFCLLSPYPSLLAGTGLFVDQYTNFFKGEGTETAVSPFEITFHTLAIPFYTENTRYCFLLKTNFSFENGDYCLSKEIDPSYPFYVNAPESESFFTYSDGKYYHFEWNAEGGYVEYIDEKMGNYLIRQIERQVKDKGDKKGTLAVLTEIGDVLYIYNLTDKNFSLEEAETYMNKNDMIKKAHGLISKSKKMGNEEKQKELRAFVQKCEKDLYMGGWKGDERNGFGLMMYFKIGDEVEGNWGNGKLNGLVKRTGVNVISEGHYVDGFPDGICLYYGRYYVIKFWESGKLQLLCSSNGNEMVILKGNMPYKMQISNGGNFEKVYAIGLLENVKCNIQRGIPGITLFGPYQVEINHHSYISCVKVYKQKQCISFYKINEYKTETGQVCLGNKTIDKLREELSAQKGVEILDRAANNVEIK